MNANPSAPREPIVGRAVALVVLTVIAYLPALRAQFVWDDNTMLSQNGLVQAADGLRRLWFTTQPVDYWPVTSSSFWLEWRLWGAHPAGYHATNLLLHLVSVLLLWAILRRLRIPGAFLAALLFALHPVNVESVAWIAQRKNLLALLFYLLAIWFFIDVENKAPSAVERVRSSFLYGLSVLSFALAMLSKGSAAMLPVVLLGLILWRRKPSWRDWARLAPFALVALGLVVVNVWFQQRDAGGWTRSAGGVERLLGAGAVVWFYLGKALFPLRLVFIYPQWRIDPANLLWWLPLIGVAVVTGTLLWRRREALLGWGYFCVSLVPVMGFTDVYFMRYSLVADHYEHLAIIGVVTAMGAGWAWWSDRSGAGAKAAAILVVGLFGVLTWRQCLTYRDTGTLFRATLERNPAAWVAHNNLGVISRHEGNTAEAMAHFQTAVQLEPDYADAHDNLALTLAEAGRLPEAMAEYRRALQSDPKLAAALSGLGAIHARLGQLTSAISYYEAALKQDPFAAETRSNLGSALMESGKLPEAVAQYAQALQLQPNLPEAHFGMAKALVKLGRPERAIEHFAAALRLRPSFAEAGNSLATNLYRMGRTAEAAEALEQVVRRRPDYIDAHYNLGVALQKLGRTAEAAAQFQEAARLKGR